MSRSAGASDAVMRRFSRPDGFLVSLAEAEGRERSRADLLVTCKSDEPHGLSAWLSAKSERAADAVPRRVPDQVGTWCIWPRPKAERVVTEAYLTLPAFGCISASVVAATSPQRQEAIPPAKW